MYIPAHFKNDDPAALRRLMREHGFATVVTVGPDGAPFASHLPLLVEEEGDGDDAMLYLRSHMARANPQWKHFAGDAETLVIFHGPHALVHSNWYDSAPNVPTWNYAWSTPTARRDCSKTLPRRAGSPTVSSRNTPRTCARSRRNTSAGCWRRW